MKARHKLLFSLGFSLLILIVVLAGASFFQLQKGIKIKRDALILQEKLDDIYGYLLDADGAAISYKNNRRDKDYNEMTQNLFRANEAILMLHGTDAHNEEIREQIRSIKNLISEKVQFTDKGKIRLKYDKPLTEDLVLTQAFRDRISEIEQLLEKSINEQQQIVETNTNLVVVVLLVGLGISLGMIFAFGFLVSKEIRFRIQLEKDLREAQSAAMAGVKAKSEFLAKVSHEIRTPLNGIIGMSDILKHQVDDLELRHKLDVIQKSGGTLLRIVNDILDLSKIEAGKIEFETHEFNFSEVVDSVVELFQNPIRRRKIHMVGFIDPTCKGIYLGDSMRIAQVLQNLVGNAIKFTEDGEVKVQINLVSEAQVGSDLVHEIEFMVLDSGIGIPQDRQSQIFQAFQQVHDKKYDQEGTQEGTGLGLSISKQLIERMGGKIGFESTVGHGSKFWFCLPLHRIAEDGGRVGDLKLGVYQKRSDLELVPKVMHGRNPRLLVVEDHPTNQILAQSFLEELGYFVSLASSGQECLHILEKESFDAILMDCQMPGMDGFETTRRIRESKISTLPIIAVTANAIRGDREKCLRNGMNDYLAKPLSLESLAQVLNRWVGPPISDCVEWATVKNLAKKTSQDVVDRLVNVFAQSLTKAIADIQVAIIQDVQIEQADKVRMIAHQIKPSAEVLGARLLSKLCHRIENQNQPLSNPNYSGLIQNFCDQALLVVHELQNHEQDRQKKLS